MMWKTQIVYCYAIDYTLQCGYDCHRGLHMELYIFLGKDSLFCLLFSTHSVSFVSGVDFCGSKI